MGNQNKHCTKTENQNKQLHAMTGVTPDEEIAKKKIQMELKNM
jgi:hypothetical protein